MGFDPVTIGAILSVIGTGTSIASAAKARSDTNNAIQAQINAQKGFQDQATPIVNKSIEDSSPQAALGQIQQGSAQAKDLYGQLGQTPVSQGLVPLSAVNTQAVRQSMGQQADAASYGQGLHNYALQQWLSNMNVGNKLGSINTLSEGSAQAAPYLAQLAQQKSAGLSAIGSLLSTAGGVAGMYGAVNNPAGGGGSSLTPIATKQPLAAQYAP